MKYDLVCLGKLKAKLLLELILFSRSGEIFECPNNVLVYCNAVSVPAPLDVLPVESLADSLNVETDPVRFSSVKFNSAGLGISL